MLDKGDAITIMDTSRSSYISSCTFREDNAIRAGGAISSFGKGMLVKTSLFHVNTAFGVGGEVETVYLLHGNIRNINCTFEENSATFRGGAIVFLGVQLLRKGYFGGDLLYSSPDVILENVPFIDSDSVNLQNSLIMQQGEYQRNILVKARVSVKCLSGKRAHSIFIFLVVYCVFCNSNSNSLSAGHYIQRISPLNRDIKNAFLVPWMAYVKKE